VKFRCINPLISSLNHIPSFLFSSALVSGLTCLQLKRQRNNENESHFTGIGGTCWFKEIQVLDADCNNLNPPPYPPLPPTFPKT
jgi:hypothetical protein